MLLFIDTETTGLVNFRLPVDHPSQPHIVQLAAMLCEDDADATPVEVFQAIIKPDGWEIQAEAEAIHGISLDYAYKFGERLEHVLENLYSMVRTVDDNFGRLVGHNVSFDIRMIIRDATTVGDFDGRFINNLRPFCTMRAMTGICRLPSRVRGQYKWPKLEEAHLHIFGQKPPETDAHTALGDTRACRDIFVEGRRREWWR